MKQISFPLNMRFASRRSVVLSTKHMVASSQPLVSSVGHSVLQAGGNAMDAAVAMGACLAVTEPCSTGLGGDMFALFYNAETRRVQGVNGSGRSGEHCSLELVKKIFPNEYRIPNSHGLAVTVPGVVAGWADSLEWFGTKQLGELLQPAIQLAEEGFPVSQVTQHWWKEEAEKQLPPCSAFSPPPARQGEVCRNQQLANTLRLIASEGKDAFYIGDVAMRIAKQVQEQGGVLNESDLGHHETTRVEVPVKHNYRSEIDVYECPPNGQGLGDRKSVV